MNKDDDFFRLPKARNPLRRAVDAGEPAQKPSKPAQAPAEPQKTAPSVGAGPSTQLRTGLPATDRAAPEVASKLAPTLERGPADAKSEATAPAKPAARKVIVDPAVADPVPATAAEPPPLNPLRRMAMQEAADQAAAAAAARLPKPQRKRIVDAGTTEPIRESGAPPDPPAPRSRRRWLWPVFGVGLIGVLVIGALIGWWVFWNVAAHLVLTDQAAMLQLPERKVLRLKTRNDLDVHMKGVITAQVPLQQTLEFPIDGSYLTDIDLDTYVPLETVITYEGVIPIDTLADIEAKAPVNFQNVKKYKNLHFKAKLPMKLRLPVKLVVPVKQNVRIKYSGPLKVHIKHVLRAPVGTTLNTALKVDQDFTLPVISSFEIDANLPKRPVAVSIRHADLNLDLSTTRLERKQEEAGHAP